MKTFCLKYTIVALLLFICNGHSDDRFAVKGLSIGMQIEDACKTANERFAGIIRYPYKVAKQTDGTFALVVDDGKSDNSAKSEQAAMFAALLGAALSAPTFQVLADQDGKVTVFWFSVNWKKRVEALRSGRVGFGV